MCLNQLHAACWKFCGLSSERRERERTTGKEVVLLTLWTEYLCSCFKHWYRVLAQHTSGSGIVDGRSAPELERGPAAKEDSKTQHNHLQKKKSQFTCILHITKKNSLLTQMYSTMSSLVPRPRGKIRAWERGYTMSCPTLQYCTAH